MLYDWLLYAACKDLSQDVFFPPKLKEDDRPAVVHAYAEGKKICKGCSCRQACLEYALSNHIEFGLWGGLTPPERKALKRERRKSYSNHLLAVDYG